MYWSNQEWGYIEGILLRGARRASYGHFWYLRACVAKRNGREPFVCRLVQTTHVFSKCACAVHALRWRRCHCEHCRAFATWTEFQQLICNAMGRFGSRPCFAGAFFGPFGMYCTVLLRYFYHSKQIGTTFSTKTNIRSNVCTLRLLQLSPKEEVRTGNTPTPIHSQFDT